MHTNEETTRSEDTKVAVRFKLSALWITLMLLYIYADIISLHKPGVIEDIIAGRMGPFPVTQASLLTASILMIIPAVMVFLCLSLNHKAARWTNITLGALYTLVNIANLLGEPWAFYVLFGSLELAATLLIAWKAWKWGRPEAQSQA